MMAGKLVAAAAVIASLAVGGTPGHLEAASDMPAEVPAAIRSERARALRAHARGQNLAVMVVSVRAQRAWVFDPDGTLVLTTAVSTGRGGVSSVAGSNGTPAGVHRVHKQVVGVRGEIVRNRGRTYTQASSRPGDHMTAAAYGMEGLERGNRNSRARGIFVHGTNRPGQLGQPLSAGCVRVSDSVALALVGVLTVGSLVTVLG